MTDIVYNKNGVAFDIDAIATDLNGKADVDLTNLNSSGTSQSAKLAMPSNTYDELIIGAAGATYTAPANGYFCVNGKDSGSTGTAYVVLRNQTRYFGVSGTNTDSSLSPSWTGYILPAKKGDEIKFYYAGGTTWNNTNWSFRFYYAEGSKGEA